MSKHKILIIDDEADFRAILTHLLSQSGFEVTSAADGEEGLAHFQKGKPDLILLDVTMPGLDGIQVCKKIHDLDPKAPPILLVTARSQLATAAEGLQAGATDYVLKPFDPEDLLRRVKQALKA